MYWLLLIVAVQTMLLVTFLRREASPSRRLLTAALLLVIPIGGPVLAWLVHRARGGATPLPVEPEEAPARGPVAADIRRVCDLPPLLERLLSTNAEERLAALVKVSATADAASVAMLRWVVEHGSREVVLDAALTLEELELRCEERLEETSQFLAEAPSFESALAAAEAAAWGILTGIADGATVSTLAERSRAAYDVALEIAPSRWLEVGERLARLELAAGRPAVALEILSTLVASLEESSQPRLRGLQDDAAFAARRFDLLSSAVGEESPASEWLN